MSTVLPDNAAEEQLQKRRIDPLRARDLFYGLKGKEWGQYRTILQVSLDQVYFTFIELTPSLFFLGLFAGAFIATQGIGQVTLSGASGQVGALWVWAIFRLGSSLVCSVLILARSGTAVASETAVMKLSKEIESLEMMGIPAMEYVFLPRILGGIISSFCANIFFLTTSFIGSLIMLNFRASFSLWEFFMQIAHALFRGEIALFMIKSLVAGLGIFWIACDHGLSLRQAGHEVPLRTVSGVIQGLKYIFTLELLSGLIFYGLYGLHF